MSIKFIKKQTGFTIVELVIATAVFSVVLLIATTAMIQISRIYYKGVTSSRTQEAARVIIEDISQSLQFQGALPESLPARTNGLPVQVLCIGPNRYSYLIGYQLKEDIPASQELKQTPQAVLKDSISGNCAQSSIDHGDNNAVIPKGTNELIPSNMRLEKLLVCRYEQVDTNGNCDTALPFTGTNALWTVRVRLVAGDEDLLDRTGADTKCKSGQRGSEFCSVSDLITNIAVRQR